MFLNKEEVFKYESAHLHDICVDLGEINGQFLLIFIFH